MNADGKAKDGWGAESFFLRANFSLVLSSPADFAVSETRGTLKAVQSVPAFIRGQPFNADQALVLARA
jgi:hypothetical protein